MLLTLLNHSRRTADQPLIQLCATMFGFDLSQCCVLLVWQYAGYSNDCHWYSTLYHIAWVGTLGSYAAAVRVLHQRVRDPFRSPPVGRCVYATDSQER